jgi:hypothetical protein
MILFLDRITDQLNKYGKEDSKREVENEELDALPHDKEGKFVEVSKTQGTLPRAPEVTPAGGTTAIREHGVWWITSDNPPWLLQVAEGERHTLQQTVPPVLPEDGAQQNEQPLVGKVKHSYDPTNQGGH